MEGIWGHYSIGVKPFICFIGVKPLCLFCFTEASQKTSLPYEILQRKPQMGFHQGEVYPVKPVRFLFNWGGFNRAPPLSLLPFLSAVSVGD